MKRKVDHLMIKAITLCLLFLFDLVKSSGTVRLLPARSVLDRSEHVLLDEENN